MCNLKKKCDVLNSPKTVGDASVPECHNKEMVIEYRCFSFDRPWSITIDNDATGTIDCTKGGAPLPAAAAADAP